MMIVEKYEALWHVELQLQSCNGCVLCSTRKHIVAGEGNPDADIMLIGEGPGNMEDVIGRPFVGASGQFLTEVLEEADILRKDIFITNMVKCRAWDTTKGKDRKPELNEIEVCKNYLKEQIRIIRPKVLVLVGGVAAGVIVQQAAIAQVRGKVFDYPLYKAMPVYHPAYLLRQGGHSSPLKPEYLKDFKKIKRLSEE